MYLFLLKCMKILNWLRVLRLKNIYCPYMSSVDTMYNLEWKTSSLLPPVSSAVDRLRGDGTRGFRETDGVVTSSELALVRGRRELRLGNGQKENGGFNFTSYNVKTIDRSSSRLWLSQEEQTPGFTFIWAFCIKKTWMILCILTSPLQTYTCTEITAWKHHSPVWQRRRQTSSTTGFHYISAKSVPNCFKTNTPKLISTWCRFIIESDIKNELKMTDFTRLKTFSCWEPSQTGSHSVFRRKYQTYLMALWHWSSLSGDICSPWGYYMYY